MPFTKSKLDIERRFPNGTGTKFSPVLSPGSCTSLDNSRTSRTKGGFRPNETGGRVGRSVVSLAKKQRQMVKKTALAVRLLEYGNQVNSPNVPSYALMYVCSRSVEQLPGESGGYLLSFTKRCGHRLCPVCNSIRQEKGVELYMPVLRQLSSPASLVLTQSSKELLGASSSSIREFIKDMTRELEAISKAFSRQFARRPNYLMTLEANPEGWKRDKKTKSIYWGPTNPHMNFVGDYDDLAWIREEWLKRSKPGRDRFPLNQKLKVKGRVDNKLRELIKYPLKCFTKGFRETKLSTGEVVERGEVSIERLDTLVSAFRGLRRIRQSGIFYAVKDESDKVDTAHIDELDLTAQVYNDVPTTGQGKEVQQFDGSFVPSYTESVVYVWDDVKRNWMFRSWYQDTEVSLVPGPPPKKFVLSVYYSKDG